MHSENTQEEGEASYQIKEECFYDYEITDSGFLLGDVGENIVQLELITEKCTDLLLQANSPVSHRFETDFNQDSKKS